jgi:hypothetical protein
MWENIKLRSAVFRDLASCSPAKVPKCPNLTSKMLNRVLNKRDMDGFIWLKRGASGGLLERQKTENIIGYMKGG